ncbi:hypothetical protein Ctob_004050 [Chrysochromulina tobinii]|uniref:Uncharacterized protein n=1 Tax=Chrysochromulina tobinii TaxID=1460289 RepID=A0A0M0JAU2_9EUKA|nr:hypothetical protein Ctob_004050 [Chrysochromulina tobinii]|eukprot:KOO23452.1 hypothetical protein Ctob_004050 [Chrysochromulina sp. CCMP291]
MPEGLLAAMWTLLIELIVPRSYMDTLLQHPNAYHTFAFLALTLLVFRTNVAYNRFWECCTSVTVMGGMWGDAFTMAITMDELINTNKREYGEAGAAWLEKRRRHQMLMARRYSLCHALALQYLRRDDCLKNLVPSDGRQPKVPMGAGAFGGMEQPTSRADPEWQQLEVLGGLTESEIRSLESSPDRVGYIFSQIMHLNAQRRCDGGLGTDPPVLSRYWSCLSSGMSGMRQARKVEDIPFPWPYTQAVALCTHLFALTFPLVLAHFANCGSVSCASPNYWMGPFLAFVTVTSFAALDQVAVALEDPFVHPPNDLPANALQAAFNNRLNTILDAVRRPADALTTNSQLVCDLDRLPEGDEKYWGEFAELEATDVKLATVNFLGQWRKSDATERATRSHRVKACMRLLLLVACCACAAARPRTGRDWSKLTDKDWDRIEDEWSTPEEKEEYEFKPPKPGKGVDIDALQKAMEKQEKLKKKGKLKKGEQSPEVKKMLAQTQQTSGPAMLFATLDYEGCCKKNETEKIGTRWATLMASAGMAVQTYVIDENMVLYSTQAGGFVNEIIEYVTQQTECVFVEFNSQQTPGPAKTPEY